MAFKPGAIVSSAHFPTSSLPTPINPVPSTHRKTTLRAAYDRAITEHGYQPDQAQLQAIEALEQTRQKLERQRPENTGALARLRNILPGKHPVARPVRGVYLYGDVGRGKTFVMDLFFDSLPFDDKLRYHFHRLMYRVHRRLAELGDLPDPLATVAGEIAGQARVICFDEFFVSDIADAMILGRLLKALFERGVTLVATSNIPPDDLYRDGLQRQKFLPAIELIKAHTNVLAVDGTTDYRLRFMEQAEIYHTPAGEQANACLLDFFRGVAPDAGTVDQDIEVLGRNIRTCRRADGIAWFDFQELCDGPRSQNDYIELARVFQTVIVANIPVLDSSREDAARRLIAMIDEFYDRHVKLVISAAARIDELYQGQRLRNEFRRTVSRLREMQSHEYLASTHRP